MNMNDIINTFNHTSSSNQESMYGYRFPLTNGNTLSVIFGDGCYSRPRQFLTHDQIGEYSEVEVAILNPQGEFVKDGVLIPTNHSDDVNVVDIETLYNFLSANGTR